MNRSIKRTVLLLLAGILVMFSMTASAQKSSDVKTAQQGLKKLGYYNGEITGNAGNKTTAALRAFQKDHKLTQTGEADSETLRAIRNAADAKKEKSQKTTSAAASGLDKKTVKTLQTNLKKLGYYNGDITGNAGNKTTAALRAFQKDHKLTQTGEADSETLRAIRNAADAKKEKSQKTTSAAASDLDKKTVKTLQTNLKKLGYYNGDITGNYGERTEKAVRKFQKAEQLSVTGKADSKTRKKINEKAGKSSSSESTGIVYNLDWYAAKKAGVFPKIGFGAGKTATLRDLESGRTLTVRIQSSGAHLDVEPVTEADTNTLCAIYGVSSAKKIGGTRRPMMLTTVHGYRLLCSCYGEPHGSDTVKGNKFSGQFCLHFNNSKTSGTDRVDSRHQKAIRRAAGMVGSSRVKTLNSPKNL